MKRSRLKLAFVGDDLTGSTDALEQVARAGLKAVLFLEAPGRGALRRFPSVAAVGVATNARALPARAAAKSAAAALRALRALRPSHVHYKICSTFDSSPRIGSIGAVIDAATGLFGQPFVPVVGGAPGLGRYCLFGTLFARMGIGSDGEIHRLDRHPSMSRHPVTPATESDLRRLLAAQTAQAIGLIDVRAVESGPAAVRRQLGKRILAGAKIVVFDALTEHHVEVIGRALRSLGSARRPLFWVGPSSVETALLRRPAAVVAGVAGPGRSAGKRRRAAVSDPGHNSSGLLVACGSRSLVTRRQVARARCQGFAMLRITGRSVLAALRALQAGRPVIGGTAGMRNVSAAQAGRALGRWTDQVLRLAARHHLRPRLIVAGGDASGWVARELGLKALTYERALTPGAPLCRAWAPGRAVDGAAVIFKGGQVGGPDYFGEVRAI